MTFEELKRVALSFPNTSQEPHFEKISFRCNKKIFATLDEKTGLLCLKLTMEQQDVYKTMGHSLVYPVPNKWGQQGWTLFDLKDCHEDLIKDVLSDSYSSVIRIRIK